MSRLLAAVVFSLTCLLPSLAHAAPGDLDTTFGDGKGWVHTSPGLYPGDNVAKSLIQQADGKLVAAGSRSSSVKDDFALARYNSDGSLDASFDGDGRLTTTVSASYDRANAVIQQADGKLVAAGISDNDFALVRYNGDGSLDTSFDGDGKLITNFSDSYSSREGANSVIQQADGKLVAAGDSNSDGGKTTFALVRYNSDGSLDTSFNGTGKVTTAIGGSTVAVAQAVIQQADGKLVAAGWHGYYGNNYSEFALARYNSDGSLDTSFDGDGKLTKATGTSIDRLYSVIQQSDGKLVAAGESNGNFALVRYNNDGSLDTSFDGNGMLTTAYNTNSVYSVIQQSDGKLVALGWGGGGFALARYNSDGSLDTTFNSTGTLNAIPGGSYAYSIIQQADEKLVAAGVTLNTDGDVFNDDFVLLRYNADGSPDTSFNGTGKITTDIGVSEAKAFSMIRQSDGKLVAAGYNASAPNGSHFDFALVRYNADGSLDTGFGSNGTVISTIGDVGNVVASVIQQEDGKLVVVGNGMVRYNSDGSLDTTFNGTGKVTVASAVGTAYSVIQQIDGKLVVTGSIWNVNNNDFALARYNSDGSLDATFDGDGMLTTAVGDGNSHDKAYSVIQQLDGKLVVAGTSDSIGSSGDFALVRYNLDGSLDATFDGDGKLTTACGGFSLDQEIAYSVIQQSDGKLVAAGVSNSIGFVLVRYNSDGSLDTAFDEDGKLATYMNGNAVANSVIQQVDGKLVVAGFSPKAFNDDFALVRYNSDGSLDTTFGDGGRQVTTISVFDDEARSVIMQPDGKLVVAGYSDGMPTGREFILARYESGLIDTDGDGYLDGLDNCANVVNPDQLNTDGDALGDVCDAFPLDAAESLDTDGDGLGNNADTDDDNDGVLDVSDAFPLNASESIDTDHDGIGNSVDVDDDNDGIADASDAFPLDATESVDADGDGIGDNTDNCPDVANVEQLNSDGDFQGEACDALPNNPDLLLEKDGTAKAENLGSSVALADMNNDGVVDLLIGSPMANVTINRAVLKKAGMIQIVSGKENSVLRTINGSAPNQQLGAAIAVVPDQNKDSVPDIVVGDPLADVTKLMYNSFPVLKDAGRVMLYSGSDGRMLGILAEGNVAGDHFGAAVAVADVNADNKVDLIVGASMADAVAKDAGQVTVFNGLGKTVLYIRNGEQAGEHFGAAVAVANGHLFVGSPRFDVATVKDAGCVSIFNSSEGSSTALLTVDGAAKGGAFGAAIAAANDDWAVGIPLADSTGKDAGSVQMFSGLNATPVKTLSGFAVGDNFGSALNMQGDVNKDGNNDLAIGASKFDVSTTVNSKAVLLKDAGRVEVLSGAAL